MTYIRILCCSVLLGTSSIVWVAACSLGVDLPQRQPEEQGVACTEASECPGVETECTTRACVDGFCAQAFMGPDLVIPDEKGNCKRNVCDGAGNLATENNDQDIDTNETVCRVNACDGGTPQAPPAALATPCGPPGSDIRFCDQDANCVECLNDPQCDAVTPGWRCVAGECAPAHCTNGTLDVGLESDTDCGIQCGLCEPDRTCTTNTDCTSQVCTNTNGMGLTCAAPECDDGVANGTETDADCGGNCILGCADGDICGAGNDCTSLVCDGNVCQTPSCIDGVANGEESDIDCGGSDGCPKCGTGKLCKMRSDCSSTNCTDNKCLARDPDEKPIPAIPASSQAAPPP